MVFLLSAITFLLGYLSHLFWLFDLISHFRLYHAVAFIGLGIWAFMTKRHFWGCNCVAIVLFICIPLIKFYRSTEDCTRTPDIKIASLNLQSENSAYALVANFISDETPDVLFLMELTTDWNQALEPSLSSYPHRLSRIREDHFGIGIFSKTKLDSVALIFPDHLGVPAIQAEISEKLPQPLRVFGIHPIPPFWPLRFKLRNGQIQQMVDLAQEESKASVIIGDFNSSSFSGSYRRILRRSSLRDSRLGFGWQTSWQSRVPGIRLAIDHAWVSEEICIARRAVGPDVGSDHRPILLELILSN